MWHKAFLITTQNIIFADLGKPPRGGEGRISLGFYLNFQYGNKPDDVDESDATLAQDFL